MLPPEMVKREEATNGNERSLDSGRPEDVAGQGVPAALPREPWNFVTNQADRQLQKNDRKHPGYARPLTKDGLGRASRNQYKNCSTDRAANFGQFLKP